MRRWLFNISALLLAALALADAVHWMIYLDTRYVGIDGSRNWDIVLERPGILRMSPGVNLQGDKVILSYPVPITPAFGRFIPIGRGITVLVPYWVSIVLKLVIPMVWMALWCRKRCAEVRGRKGGAVVENGLEQAVCQSVSSTNRGLWRGRFALALGRGLIAISSIASVLLCVLLADFWISSRYELIGYGWQTGKHFDAIFFRGGSMHLFTADYSLLKKIKQPKADEGARFFYGERPIMHIGPLMNDQPWSEQRLLGFGKGGRPDGSIQFIAWPVWVMMFATLVMPTIWILLARRRSIMDTRKRMGECITCGYDLRASKERCPECGTAIEPRTQSKATESFLSGPQNV